MTPMEAYPGGHARRWRASSVPRLVSSIIVIDDTILAVAFPSTERPTRLRHLTAYIALN